LSSKHGYFDDHDSQPPHPPTTTSKKWVELGT
jgi:hypothetical protein